MFSPHQQQMYRPYVSRLQEFANRCTSVSMHTNQVAAEDGADQEDRHSFEDHGGDENGGGECLQQVADQYDRLSLDGHRTYNQRYNNNHIGAGGGGNGGGGFNPRGKPRASREKVYELEGHHKFNNQSQSKGIKCPNCIMTCFAQITTYRGVPWCRRNYREDYHQIYQGLNAELNDFYEYMKPKPQDEYIRKGTFYAIAKSVKQVKSAFDIESVKYYGSYSSNTYLPVSDIDLVVYCNRKDMDHRAESALLTMIGDQLITDGIIEQSCTVIEDARIPLLKFNDSLTGLPINITVNTKLVMDRTCFIRDHIQPDSYEIKILYFLKFYLLHKSSNNVYSGGIGSFSLSVMVIRYFQEERTQELIRDCEEDSILGYLLIGFLDRFSDIDFIRSHSISVNNGGSYDPIVHSVRDSTYHSGKKQSVLYIKDPLEPWRHMSAGSYNSDLILQDFGYVKENLLARVPKTRHTRRSFLANAVTVVDSFVHYRNILNDIYRSSFEPYIKKRSRFGHEMYSDFIHFRVQSRDVLVKYDRNDNGVVTVFASNEPVTILHHSHSSPANSRGSQSPDLMSSDFYSSNSLASGSSNEDGYEMDSPRSNEDFSKHYQQTIELNCFNGHYARNRNNRSDNRNRTGYRSNGRRGYEQENDYNRANLDRYLEPNGGFTGGGDRGGGWSNRRPYPYHPATNHPNRVPYRGNNRMNRTRRTRHLTDTQQQPPPPPPPVVNTHATSKESESKANEIKKLLKMNDDNARAQ